MKPSKEAIERGAVALHLFDGINPWARTSDETKEGFRQRAAKVIVAALTGEILEDGPGSPEHPVGLVELEDS